MATPKRGGHDSALAGMLGVLPPNMQKVARCAGEIEGLIKDIPSGKTARLQTAKKPERMFFIASALTHTNGCAVIIQKIFLYQR